MPVQTGERSGLRIHPLLAKAGAMRELRKNPWFEILDYQGSIIEGYSLKKDQPGVVVRVLEAVGQGNVSEAIKKWAKSQADSIEAKRDPSREIVAYAFRFSPWLHQKDGKALFDSSGVAMVVNEITKRVDVLVSGTREHRGWVDVAQVYGGAHSTAEMALAGQLSQAFEAKGRIWPLPDLRLNQGPDGYRVILLTQPDAALFRGLEQAPIQPGVAKIIR